MSTALSQKGFSKRTRIIIVFALVAVGILGLLQSGVFGDTTIGVTLTSNPDLKRGLVGHWTFDGSDIDISQTSAEVRDSSGQGNHGDLQGNVSAGAPTVNNVQSAVGNQVADITISDYTPTSGANGKLEVVVTYEDDFDKSITSVTYAGNNLTQAVSAEANNGSFWNGADIWYLDDPLSLAASGDIVADPEGTVDNVTVIARTLLGVASGAPAATDNPNTAAGTSLSGSVTPAQDDSLVSSGFTSSNVRTLTATSPHEEDGTQADTGSSSSQSGHTDVATAEATTVEWSIDGADSRLALAIAAWSPAAGAASSLPTTLGRIGQALTFDGIDDYVDVGNVLDAPSAITVSFWTKTSSSTSPTLGLVSKGGSGQAGYRFMRTSDTVYAWQGLTSAGDGAFNINTAVPLNIWTHYVGTYDGTTAALYADGALIGSDATASGAITSQAGTNKIGTLFTTCCFVDNQMDDVRIYNRALSAEEAKRLYELGATTKIATTITSNPTLETGLVGHWSFDGPDLLQNATDRSGQGNTGYLSGFTSTTTVIGRIGQALQFDGSNDYVSIPDSAALSPTSEITVSAWIKTTNLDEAFVAHYDTGTGERAWDLLTDSSGLLRAVVSDDGTDTSSHRKDYRGEQIADNVWHHAVFTFQGTGSVLNLYVDGILDASPTKVVDPAITSIHDSTAAVSIGAQLNNGAVSSASAGTIDDVRIYDRVLSSQEIKRLYELGATTKIATTITSNPTLETGLVGHWSFDGPDLLQNAADRSGQGNTGYLTNITATTTAPGRLGQALSFNSSDDEYVDIANSPELQLDTSDFTIGMWIYSEGVVDENHEDLYTQGADGTGTGEFAFFINSDETLRFIREGSVILSSGKVVADGTWHFITAVREGDRLTLYDNAVSEATNATYFSGISLNDTAGSAIARGHGGLRFFAGTIDDVRVYNRALSPQEIKRLYELGN
jgi:hypothetical protein